MLTLATKLHIPSLRRNLVPRQRLLERLDQGLRRRLTLVSAPAGFGKTTLLSEWVHSLEARRSPPMQVGWVTLDDGDNDPARFSAYLTAAFRRANMSSGQPAADTLESTGSLVQEMHLVRLINQVAALPRSFVLVLDDYHLITAQVIHDAVTFLVDHLPENLHVVLATRADPPLSLPRLRARGQLTELRQSDLRFTTEEAAAFLNKVMGLALSAEDVAALEARTEGWIAGLQMAALAMQARLSPQGQRQDLTHRARAEFIQVFTGSHRFVLDYLGEEVLEQQPPDLQEFLLKTAILERLTGSLCDAVLDSEESSVDSAHIQDTTPDARIPGQQILEHLEATNLFIVPLDDERQWYRYHRLFSDLLRRRLWQASPELVPVLHGRASVWHEQQGLMAAAIDHALSAHDFERAGSLIEANVEETLMRSEVTTFLNWMERLPEERVAGRPTLRFFHAWALVMNGHSLAAVGQRLQDIAWVEYPPESAGTTEGNVLAARITALRAYLMLFQADTHRAAELCHQALDHLPESDLFLRSIVAWILSLARLADGDLQNGQQALTEVARMGQEIGNPLIAVAALCHQAKLQMRQGHLHRAQEILGRAMQLATDPQGRRLPIASKALIDLGELEREWNDLAAAEDYIAQGIELATEWSALAVFEAYFPLARIRLAQGDLKSAREAIETARQIARRSDATDMDDLIAELQQAYLHTIAGEFDEAVLWAQRRGLVPGSTTEAHPGVDEGQDFVSARLRKYELLVLARLFILQGRAAEALDLLELLLDLARQLDRVDLKIEIQILNALAHQAIDQDAQASAALAEALSLAEPGGYVRVFVDEGKPMARLLRQAAARGIAPVYVARLLENLRAESSEVEARPSPTGTTSLIEPLTGRELEVLRLLAAGLSNPEIADELIIAVSTVRSHCKSIYGKLDVHKRWDAVQRAQELGLI